MFVMLRGSTQTYTGPGNYDSNFDGFVTTDKARRFRNCITDLENGTVSIELERESSTEVRVLRGAFPNGPARVIFQDDTYDPPKDPAVPGAETRSPGTGTTSPSRPEPRCSGAHRWASRIRVSRLRPPCGAGHERSTSAHWSDRRTGRLPTPSSGPTLARPAGTAVMSASDRDHQRRVRAGAQGPERDGDGSA